VVKDPERQCIGCGRRRPQGAFLRLAVVGEGSLARVVVVDGSEHMGRGAYLCRRKACVERAISRKAFQRAFRKRVCVDRDEMVAAIGVGGDWEESDGG
jgi:predicted RNA-binding protein YlxR (DUF448 family)